MTYKKVDQLFGRWLLFYMVHCALGTMVLLSGIAKRDWFVSFLGLMIGGSGMWSYRKMMSHQQLRYQIIEVWEKKFDDVEFLLINADMLNYRDGLLSLLWRGSPATSEVSGLAVMRAADLYRTPRAFNPQAWFHAQMVGAWGDGGLEQPSEGVFRIGRRVFDQAKKKYPLKDFETTIENSKPTSEHILAT